VVDRLAASRSVWLSTRRPDGRPHAAPVWGVVVGEAFWFWTSVASIKGRNLAADARLVLQLEAADDVVIVEGLGHAQPPTTAVVAAYTAKYREPSPEPSFWRVESTGALAWRGHTGAEQVDATRFVL
jgi:hypothetical protein